MKRSNAMKRTVLWLLVGVAILAASGCATTPATLDTVNIATLNWPPYIDPSAPKGGAATDIITTALERAGYEAVIHHMPWKDAIAQTAEGKYDGIYPAYFSEERLKTFLVSEPFMAGPVVLCAIKSKKIEYESLESLKPYRIGVVAGYVNSKKFDKADYLNKIVGESDKSNLAKLLRGDLDLVVLDRMVGVSLIEKNKELGSTSQYSFLSPPLSTRDCYLMLPRCLRTSEACQERFDKAIRAMRDDGTIEKIMRKHGF